jgi:hypothetical protein
MESLVCAIFFWNRWSVQQRPEELLVLAISSDTWALKEDVRKITSLTLSHSVIRSIWLFTKI